MTGPSPAWYGDLVDGWQRALQRRGRARNTCRTYLVWADHFGRFLAAEGSQEPHGLAPGLLHRWQDSLAVYQSGTRSVAVSAVRSLLRWAAREELGIRAGLWESLEPVEVPETLPRPLEPGALRLILAHYAAAPRTLEGWRDRALFLFLLTTGCRVSEGIRVDRAQLRGRMVVRQKGGREHVLIMSARSREWVTAWLNRRGPDPEPALWVRVGPRGLHRLRAEEVNAIWRRLALQLEIPTFTAHVLRHTSGTELLEQGANQLEIATHLGHRGLATVHRYAKLREDRRQRLVDRLDELVPPAPPGNVVVPSARRRRRSPRILPWAQPDGPK